MTALRAMGTLLGLSILISACTGGSGTVVDAGSGEPVARAVVTITSAGLGQRDGRMVIDAAHSRTAISDANGVFHFPSGASGYAMVVTAPHYPPTKSNLPSRWPAVVRIGGPYSPDALLLALPLDANRSGWRFGRSPGLAAQPEADLWIDPRPDLDGRDPTVSFHAPRGLLFVAGVGQPPAPPANGFKPAAMVTLSASGWVFVKAVDGSIPAVATGSYATDSGKSGGATLTLNYRTIGTATSAR